MSNGPSSKRDGVEGDFGSDGHWNVAAANPISSVCRSSYDAVSEEAHVGTSLSRRNPSMRCIETYATKVSKQFGLLDLQAYRVTLRKIGPGGLSSALEVAKIGQ